VSCAATAARPVTAEGATSFSRHSRFGRTDGHRQAVVSIRGLHAETAPDKLGDAMSVDAGRVSDMTSIDAARTLIRQQLPL
jgi:hypothetical protein